MVIGDRGVARGGPLLVDQEAPPGRWAPGWCARSRDTDVPDTTSGFRALTREAALRINIVSEFTYTLESIIQAGKKKMAVAHLPIEAAETRPSRLFGSTWEYVKRSGATILRIYAMYEPFKVFILLGSAAVRGGLALGLRYAWFWWHGRDPGPPPVGDPLGAAADPRLPDPAVGDHGRPHREQPQADRGPALPRPQGGARGDRATVAEARDVSVVIPAFNEEEGIAAVVAGVLAREPWREVLVVDDGSTDATAERAAAAGARVVRHPYNKGNGAAVKTGIREATGESCC